ncbi:flippase [Elusimicrobiota bacterium]
MKIKGSLLAKNTIFNLIGYVAPFLVSFFAVPYVIGGLGVERYGILALVFAVVAYFNMIDLGLGLGTAKFVAEALGKNDHKRIPQIVIMSVGALLVLGSLGVVMLILATPLLVERVFNVAPHLEAEMKATIYITSFSILITIVTNSLIGALEAYQRFDIINLIRLPSNLSATLIPVGVIFLGGGLAAIMLCHVAKNIIALLGYMIFCSRILPRPKNIFQIDKDLARSLFSFGGWLTLLNISGGLLRDIERFFIGALLTVKAVGYYSPPYQIANITTFFSGSIMPVLFSAFSTLQAQDKERMEKLFYRALKYIFVLIGSMILVMMLFSEEMLVLWLGDDFAKSAWTLRYLAFAFLLSPVAWCMSTLLQSTGYVKQMSLIVLIQSPFQILATWVFVKELGMEGAALSLVAHHTWIVLIYYWACRRFVGIRSLLHYAPMCLKPAVGFAAGIIVIMALKGMIPFGFWSTISLISLFLTYWASVSWLYVFHDDDKKMMWEMLEKLRLRLTTGKRA